MKLKITTISFALTLGLMFYNFNFSKVHSSSSGAPAGSSGAPGETTCATSGCHSGTSTPVNGIDAISTDIPASGYVPGSTYTITIGGTNPLGGNIARAGFQASIQKNGAKAGTIINTSSETKLISSGKYITHTTAGTAAGTPTKFYTFQWTAPNNTTTGDVTIYAAMNIANNDGGTAGDIILNTSLVFPLDVTSSIKENEINHVSIFPNPFTSEVNINFNSKTNGQSYLYSIDGRLIKTINENSIQNKLSVENLANGMYFLQFNVEGKSYVKKLIKK